MWAAHEVEARRPVLKRIYHSQAGSLEFECQIGDRHPGPALTAHEHQHQNNPSVAPRDSHRMTGNPRVTAGMCAVSAGVSVTLCGFREAQAPRRCKARRKRTGSRSIADVPHRGMFRRRTAATSPTRSTMSSPARTSRSARYSSATPGNSGGRSHWIPEGQ